MTTETIAIVGASLAGARAAQVLRQQRKDLRVLLIGDELWAPYERPPLSKSALLQDSEPTWIFPSTWCEEQGVKLVTGRKVVAVERAGAFTLTLADGEKLSADKVLLTTGGRPRPLPQAEGIGQVHYLRTWDDARRLKLALRPGAKLIVVGSGFIGAEVAATGSEAGCRVEVLEAAPNFFGAIHCPVVRSRLIAAHREAGVRLRAGVKISRLKATEREIMVTIEQGDNLLADLIVVGIGMLPNAELATSLGARLEAGGIAVDDEYRTSVPGLYAAGDVATRCTVDGHSRRYEHWRSAQEQGVGAAYSILRLPVPPLSPAWCWSDQCGQRLEIAGEPAHWHTRIDRSLSDREHITFHLDGTRLSGITALNSSRLLRAGMAKLVNPWHPDPAQLRDVTLPINKVGTLDSSNEALQ
nr:C560 [uncultured bacterium]